MSWNASLVAVVNLSDNTTTGYGLNLPPNYPLSDAAKAYVIEPTSPDCVFAGDPGVPETVTITAPDGTVSNQPNPAWTPSSPKYTTLFLRFPDQATAQATLPDLWTPDA